MNKYIIYIKFSKRFSFYCIHRLMNFFISLRAIKKIVFIRIRSRNRERELVAQLYFVFPIVDEEL